MHEEKQQQVAALRGMTTVEGAAFIASKAHTKSVSTHGAIGTHDTSKLYYDYCKKHKHTRETCFELHGYPDWWGKNRSKRGHGKSANNASVLIHQLMVFQGAI